MNNRKRTKNRYVKKQLEYYENLFARFAKYAPETLAYDIEINEEEFNSGIVNASVTIYPKYPIIREIFKLEMTK